MWRHWWTTTLRNINIFLPDFCCCFLFHVLFFVWAFGFSGLTAKSSCKRCSPRCSRRRSSSPSSRHRQRPEEDSSLKFNLIFSFWYSRFINETLIIRCYRIQSCDDSRTKNRGKLQVTSEEPNIYHILCLYLMFQYSWAQIFLELKPRK